jgi:hypothetical protein
MRGRVVVDDVDDGQIIPDANGNFNIEIIDGYEQAQSPLAQAAEEEPVEFIEDPDSEPESEASTPSTDEDEVAELMERTASPSPPVPNVPSIVVMVGVQDHPLADLPRKKSDSVPAPVEGQAPNILGHQRRLSFNSLFPASEPASPALDQVTTPFPLAEFPDPADLSKENENSWNPTGEISNFWNSCGCCKSMLSMFWTAKKVKVDNQISQPEMESNRLGTAGATEMLRHRSG